MTARRLMRNGYMAYLACVVESEKKKKEILKDIHVVREFPDVFPKELPRLLQKKKRLRFLLKPCLELYL
jgi:hypothetical protein